MCLGYPDGREEHWQRKGEIVPPCQAGNQESGEEKKRDMGKSASKGIEVEVPRRTSQGKRLQQLKNEIEDSEGGVSHCR